MNPWRYTCGVIGGGLLGVGWCLLVVGTIVKYTDDGSETRGDAPKLLWTSQAVIAVGSCVATLGAIL